MQYSNLLMVQIQLKFLTLCCATHFLIILMNNYFSLYKKQCASCKFFSKIFAYYGWLPFKRGVCYVGPFIVKLCSFLHSMSESGFFFASPFSIMMSTACQIAQGIFLFFIKMTHQYLWNFLSTGCLYIFQNSYFNIFKVAYFLIHF